MNRSRINLFLCFAAIPIVLHFYLLNQTIVNFPSWGDDFLFFELIEHAHKDSWAQTLAFLFKPHNQIHLLFFGKAFALLSYWVFGSLQIKYTILTANLVLLGGISFLFFKYLKNQNHGIWHFAGIMCILFAPSASIDNYQLIGVLQHSGSLLFLTFIAYATATRKHTKALLLAVAFYPLVSTEGWAMLPILAVYMLLTKHPLRKIVSVMAALGLGIFAYFLAQHPQPGASNSILNILFQAPIALLTFLGNAAWPISDSFKIQINALLGVLLFVLSIIFVRKNRHLEMPIILWLHVLATGAMICVGRSQGTTISTLILSERFHSYASFALIGTYLLGIPLFNKSSVRRKLIGLTVCLYFTGSYYYFTKGQDAFHNRLRADLTNAYQHASLLSYPAASNQISALMHANYFKVDSNDLLLSNLAIPAEYKALKAYSIENRNGQITLKFNVLPEKKSKEDQRWLAIQSTTHPNSTLLIAFMRDQENKPRVVHVNSLQLTNLKLKNLWLFTQQANGKIETAYLGSIK